MTERLVPYRSLKQVTADANVLIALFATSALAIGTLLIDASIEVRGGLAAVCFFAAALLSEAVANWRARRRGAELIAPSEWYRRVLSERAAAPLWHSCASVGLGTASMAAIFALAALPIQMWPSAVPFVVFTGLGGMLGGAYSWGTARGHRKLAERGAPPSSFATYAMRHYAGYVLGIAAMLFVSPLLGPEPPSSLFLFAAFVAGKVISDMLAPPLSLNLGADLQPSITRMLRGSVWAVVFWGIPLGIVIGIMMHHEMGQFDLSDAAAAFVPPSIGAIVFYLFLTALTRIRRRR